jgi:hypothetical protein
VVGDGLGRCKPRQGLPRHSRLVSRRPTDAHLRPGWVPGGRRHVRYTNLGTLNWTAEFLRHLLRHTIKLTSRLHFTTINSPSPTLLNTSNSKSQQPYQIPSLQHESHQPPQKQTTNMRFTILIAAFLTTLAAALPTAEPAAEPVLQRRQGYSGPCSRSNCGASGAVCRSGQLCVGFPVLSGPERQGCTCSNA